MISMIAAVGQNREIGRGGDLVFHLKKDMAFFKQTTMGHTVLMGRKTWESLPKKLPNRVNLVATRRTDVKGADGVVTDLAEFQEKPGEEVFVIGGEEIYWQMLPRANALYLTEIQATAEGADRFFPEFAPEDWERTVLKQDEEDGVKFEIVRYARKTPPEVQEEVTLEVDGERKKGEER